MPTVVTALCKSKSERSQLILLICVSQAASTHDEVGHVPHSLLLDPEPRKVPLGEDSQNIVD